VKARYALVLAALLASASVALAATGFQGTLSGANEVPPNGSPGTGTATVILNDAGTEIAYTISYTGLVGTVTASHIHKAPIGTNGSVIIGFSPPLGSTSGVFGGVAAVTPAQVADLLAGLYYVNIHTNVYPGGELRAQLEGAPTPAGKSTWGRIKQLYR
jgi:hypothetical protein